MLALKHLAVLTALALASAAEGGQPQTEAEARRPLARALLKISPNPPDVAVQIVDRRTEEGLIVEDLQWQSLDGQRASAILVRPDTGSRLPAVVCLHGTGGSRESRTTHTFGPGPWTRPGTTEPHTRMLGWARELARRGFVTLALTQRGLDRRAPPDTNDQAKDLLVRGRTLMGAIVHEIRQAVTYLERRDDVQRDRIAVAGMSFGGITSFYTWAVDGRVAAAASICGGVRRSTSCFAPAVRRITASTGGSRTCSLAGISPTSPRRSRHGRSCYGRQRVISACRRKELTGSCRTFVRRTRVYRRRRIWWFTSPTASATHRRRIRGDGQVSREVIATSHVAVFSAASRACIPRLRSDRPGFWHLRRRALRHR